MTNDLVIDVVICTYNRAAGLETTLRTLAAQTDRSGRWRVTVVENNCSDHTNDVVRHAIDTSSVPGLRLVSETKQGLVEARRRGMVATTAPWIAFVDDDCELAEDWMEHALMFAMANPTVAGFNGRNVVVFDGPAHRCIHPGMFAGFDARVDHPVVIGSLHGAGLVLRREAVVRSGWLDRPLLPDRRGRSLVSGGDNEMAVRARAGAAGGELWFVPGCRLVHRIGAERTRLSYLVRLNFGLAAAQPLMYALKADHSERVWRARMARASGSFVARALGVCPPIVSPDPLAIRGSGARGRLLSVSRAAGFLVGFGRLLVAPKVQRAEILGLATRSAVETRLATHE